MAGGLRHPGTPVLDGQQPVAGPLELVHQLGDPGRGPAAPRRPGAPGPTSRGIPAGGLRHPGARWAAAGGGAPGVRPPAGGSRPGACGTPVPERARDLILLNLVA